MTHWIVHYSLAREFCLDKGHTFTYQLDKVWFLDLTYFSADISTLARDSISDCLSLFSLQIQCILQDVGSNIATPQSSARESHISKHTLARSIQSNCYFALCDEIFKFSLFCFCKREQNLLLSQLQTWKPGLIHLQRTFRHWPALFYL